MAHRPRSMTPQWLIRNRARRWSFLVVSNTVHPSDVDNIFNLMQAGALDFFPKPTSGTAMDYDKLKSTLITKIKVLASKKV